MQKYGYAKYAEPDAREAKWEYLDSILRLRVSRTRMLRSNEGRRNQMSSGKFPPSLDPAAPATVDDKKDKAKGSGKGKGKGKGKGNGKGDKGKTKGDIPAAPGPTAGRRK